jgi:hypothetical protein
MRKIVLALAPLVLLTGPALAQSAGDRGPGGGSDLYRVTREVEAMQRDGRWEKLLAEGAANRQASEASRQAPVTATGSVPRRRR